MLRSAIDGKTREISRLARAFRRRYGAEAEVVAAGHADTMLDSGDVDAF